MSRALAQLAKAAPSLPSGSSGAPTPRSPFSTSAPLEKRHRHSGKKIPSSPLVIPAYSQPSKIKYSQFIDALRARNPTVKAVTQAEAQRALRQYFVGFFGREDFEDVRRGSRASAASDKEKAAWARLCEEGQQYWKKR